MLEVGAGIGATTLSLCDGSHQRWVCLEPDPALAKQIDLLLKEERLPPCCEVVNGTVENISGQFDSIIYIDVLEHIEDDAGQLNLVAAHLKPGGFLIVLSPAHQTLYTAFDRSIGHCRRYDKNALISVGPASLQGVEFIYLDSVGALASLGNKYLLKSGMPNVQQIAFWDKIMIPLSRIIDPILQYKVGKTIIGVWQR
ncbi:MAG: class I SAM-dependent methyltransferase [Pyrinomonadaceae bacterium]